MIRRLQLYVWTDFCTDWTEGLAVAVATSEEEAKRMVETKMGYKITSWGKLMVHKLNEKIAYGVTGGS